MHINNTSKFLNKIFLFIFVFIDYDTHKYVINIDDSIVAICPPLGWFNDPQSCHKSFIQNFSKEILFCISIGTEIKKMKMEEFMEFCYAYLKRNFPNVRNVVQFPPLEMIANQAVKSVADLFTRLLSTRTSFRVVLTNLNSKKYFQCCTKTDDILQRDLPYQNRIMVFDQESKSILNIRVVEQTRFNGDVHREIEHCNKDMQYFVSAHRNRPCGCFIIGVLAFPNMNYAELKSELSYYFTKETTHLLRLFVLSKEDLEDDQSLQTWWNDVFENELDNISGCNTKFTEKGFQLICAQSMATIALAKMSPKLPSLSPDTHQQINSLLLNADQLKAIESPSNRKMIIGNYGTGKSIVLDEIARRKFNESILQNRTSTLILYLVWEAYSLLEVQKKLFMEELKRNAKDPQHVTLIFGNSFGVWKDISRGQEITLLHILKYYFEKRNYEVVHVLIDEVPTNVVHVSELNAVNELLKKHTKYSLAIAPQSVVIDCKTSTPSTESSSVEEEKNHNRNCLHKLEMDHFHLAKVMRNSKQVTAVMKASQDHLEGKETVLGICKPESIIQEETHSNTHTELSAVSHQTPEENYTEESITSEPKANNNVIEDSSNIVHDSLLKTDAKKKELMLNICDSKQDSENRKSNLNMINKTNSSLQTPPLELEKISKLIDSEKGEETATSFMKTTYKFHPIQNGNGVTDRKPVFVRLPSEVDFQSDLSAKVLFFALNELCLKEKASTMILCSNMEEIRMISYCLSLIPNFKYVTYIPQLCGYFPTKEERHHIFNAFNSGSCLLTDNTGIKGMEAKRVVIFAERDEYFLKHIINETLSRATVWVHIFLHSPEKCFSNRYTLSDLFRDLERKELFEVQRVEVFEDHVNFEEPFVNNNCVFKVNRVYDKQWTMSFPDHCVWFNRQFPLKQSTASHRYVDILVSIQFIELLPRSSN